jgi:hypothetical protein
MTNTVASRLERKMLVQRERNRPFKFDGHEWETKTRRAGPCFPLLIIEPRVSETMFLS